MSRELTDAYDAYFAASMAVWNDAEVWRQEAASSDHRLMAWPRPMGASTVFARHLAGLFNDDVNMVLVLLRERGNPYSPAWPPDVRDPMMQTVLRIVQRGHEAGEKAMVEAFGGERVTGRKEFKNRSNEQVAEFALRLARVFGLTRDEAFEAVGLPRRLAFRAVKRTHRKK